MIFFYEVVVTTLDFGSSRWRFNLQQTIIIRLLGLNRTSQILWGLG